MKCPRCNTPARLTIVLRKDEPHPPIRFYECPIPQCRHQFEAVAVETPTPGSQAGS